MTHKLDREPAELALSRPFPAAQAPAEGLDMAISANARERAAIAAANGLPALERFEARLRITRFGAGGLKVCGEVTADARQRCVVTLEEFETRIVESIEARFTPQHEAAPTTPGGKGGGRARADRQTAAPEHHIVSLDDDPPDPLIGGVVDLGALACEFFALGLDPYPRKPGATFAEPAPASDEISPFAKLLSKTRTSRKAVSGGSDP